MKNSYGDLTVGAILQEILMCEVDAMIQQHGKLLQIQHRLKTMVESQGDLGFAAALGKCIETASGQRTEFTDCPFRQLLVEDYVKGGLTPIDACSVLSQPPSAVSEALGAIPREAMLQRIKTLLKEDAKRLDDKRYLEALVQCDESTKNNPHCPFYQPDAKSA